MAIGNGEFDGESVGATGGYSSGAQATSESSHDAAGSGSLSGASTAGSSSGGHSSVGGLEGRDKAQAAIGNVEAKDIGNMIADFFGISLDRQRDTDKQRDTEFDHQDILDFDELEPLDHRQAPKTRHQTPTTDQPIDFSVDRLNQLREEALSKQPNPLGRYGVQALAGVPGLIGGLAFSGLNHLGMPNIGPALTAEESAQIAEMEAPFGGSVGEGPEYLLPNSPLGTDPRIIEFKSKYPEGWTYGLSDNEILDMIDNPLALERWASWHQSYSMQDNVWAQS